MKKFKYKILTTEGEVTADHIPDAVVESVKDFYNNKKMINPEVLDFQFMTIEVKEIK